MNTTIFVTKLIQFLVIIPAAFLCYLPMKNQLRYRPEKIFLLSILCLGITLPICSLIAAYFLLDTNFLLLPLLFLLFLCYHFTLKTTIWQNSTVFFSVCALAAFFGNFSYALDAGLHPLGKAAQFSWESTIFQFGQTIIIAGLITYPLYRYGSFMIDSPELSSIWHVFLPIPLIFLTINLIIIPHNYETIHTNNAFPMYLLMLIFMLALMLFIYILFYRIAVSIITSINNRERIRFFEMQESQYLSQKNYMEQTEKLRHDFRQSVYTLKQLSASKDWSSLEKYLTLYEETLPQKETISWCQNPAVNALLNYYSHTANQNKIHLKWDIKLDPSLHIAEPDLCSLLGNILENAIGGCLTEDTDKRYHQLSMTVRGQNSLYIVSINNFNGVVKTKGNRYLSTKRKGSGAGISSITMTAEKYNGIARFSHNQHTFTVDVMLRQPSFSG